MLPRSIGKYSKQVTASSDYPCSLLLEDKMKERKAAFSEWMFYGSEYQNELKKVLKNGRYPIYVESSIDGKRRWILVKKKNGLGISISSGKSLENFRKSDLLRKVKGKTLITTHCLEIDGTIFYSGVWVANEHFESELRKLKRYGINKLEQLKPVWNEEKNKIVQEKNIATAAHSISTCKEIRSSGRKPNGIYEVEQTNYNGKRKLNLFCDMTTDGGGWTQIYKLNIPRNNVNWMEYNDIPYSVDLSDIDMKFDRIAYKLKLDDKFVWASMSDFTDGNLKRIGIPVDWHYQIRVSNLNVISNRKNIANDINSDNGNIEFWRNCYNMGVTGKHDHSDGMLRSASCFYGSFQIFNKKNALFSYNKWAPDRQSISEDLGMGNNLGGNFCERSNQPDWSFCFNSHLYNKRELDIYVR